MTQLPFYATVVIIIVAAALGPVLCCLVSAKYGVFQTSDTKMVSELIRVVLSGKADLVKETLHFRIVPTAVTTGSAKTEKIKKSEVTVPVIVSGTFQDPKFRPDLEKVTQKAIEKEILESKEYKKALEKNPELKQLEEPAKQLLKGIFGD